MKLKKLKKYKITILFGLVITAWFLVVHLLLSNIGVENVDLAWSTDKSDLLILISSLTNISFPHLLYNLFSLTIIGIILESKIKDHNYFYLMIFFYISTIPIYNITTLISDNIMIIGSSALTSIMIGSYVGFSNSYVEFSNIEENVLEIIVLITVIIYTILEIYIFYRNKDPSKLAHITGIVYGFISSLIIWKLFLSSRN